MTRQFADHLLTLGIAAHIEEDKIGWAIWVEDDDQLDRAREELRAYQDDPNDARYGGAEQSAQRVRDENKQKLRRVRNTVVDVRTSWAHPAQGARPVTFGLIILSVIVMAATWSNRNFFALNPLRITSVRILEGVGDGDVPYYAPGLPEVRHGQVWRLITPIFIHFGILHLLFNMMLLRDMGSLIEVRRGTWFLLILVIAAAAPSNLLQYYHSGPFFGGMSGVVYALFGYAWMKGRYQPEEGIVLHPDLPFTMIAWLFLCMTGWVGPVANAAHVGGLLVGMAMGIAPYLYRRLRR